MKILLIILASLFTTHVWSDITVTWEPGPVVGGTPVDQWLLFCAADNAAYPSPIVIPEIQRTHTLTVPDGVNKCMMRSRSNNNVWNIVPLDSENSVEITFLVSGGVRVNPAPKPPSLAIN